MQREVLQSKKKLKGTYGEVLQNKRRGLVSKETVVLRRWGRET